MWSQTLENMLHKIASFVMTGLQLYSTTCVVIQQNCTTAPKKNLMFLKMTVLSVWEVITLHHKHKQQDVLLCHNRTHKANQLRRMLRVKYKLRPAGAKQRHPFPSYFIQD